MTTVQLANNATSTNVQFIWLSLTVSVIFLCCSWIQSLETLRNWRKSMASSKSEQWHWDNVTGFVSFVEAFLAGNSLYYVGCLGTSTVFTRHWALFSRCCYWLSGRETDNALSSRACVGCGMTGCTSLFWAPNRHKNSKLHSENSNSDCFSRRLSKVKIASVAKRSSALFRLVVEIDAMQKVRHRAWGPRHIVPELWLCSPGTIRSYSDAFDVLRHAAVQVAGVRAFLRASELMSDEQAGLSYTLAKFLFSFSPSGSGGVLAQDGTKEDQHRQDHGRAQPSGEPCTQSCHRRSPTFVRYVWC